MLSCEDWIIATKSFCFLNSADTLLQNCKIAAGRMDLLLSLSMNHLPKPPLGCTFSGPFILCMCLCVCLCVKEREREREIRERDCVCMTEEFLGCTPNLEVIPGFSLSYDVSASLPSSF